MTTAQMTDSPTTTIPDARWISLNTVAFAIDGRHDGLENQCIRLGIEYDQPIGGRPSYVQMKDLPALVGEAKARSIAASYGPEFVKTHIAGAAVGVTWTEVAALAERRGVLVMRRGGYPTVSYGAMVILRRILEVERSYEVPDDDWFRAELVLPRMRAAMTTQITGGLEWDPIDMSDPNAPRLNAAGELVTRCRWMGIRWKQGGGLKFRAVRGVGLPWNVVGFDLYRLLGITMNPGKVDAYREMMAEAHAAFVRPDPSAA